MIDQLDFAKSPLIPAVVQDAATRQVLMLGFMNADAVRKTLDTGLVTFFSRSRKTLWTKGETSGNTLKLVELYPDCDRDTLLVMATPAGPTCHRNTTTCFDQPAAADLGFLSGLEATIAQRLRDGADDSYVASLAARGLPRIAQKVGEEAVETALAAVTGSDDDTLSESADLLFHLMVLLNAKGLSLREVVTKLAARSKN